MWKVFPKKLVSFSTWIDHTRWARNTWAMAAIFILTVADITDMVSSSLRFLTPAKTKPVYIELYSRALFFNLRAGPFSAYCNTPLIFLITP